MGDEWRESTVADIAAQVRNALVGGPFGSNLVSKDYVDAGVPVIRGQNLALAGYQASSFLLPMRKHRPLRQISRGRVMSCLRNAEHSVR